MSDIIIWGLTITFGLLLGLLNLKLKVYGKGSSSLPMKTLPLKCLKHQITTI